MNTGVEILLKRMQDCPEDFACNVSYGSPSRWMRLVDHAIGNEILTQEERDALEAGLKEVKRLRFTELVMKELAGEADDPKSEAEEWANRTMLGKGISTAGATLTYDSSNKPTWATTSSMTMQEVMDAQKLQTELMKKHLDEHREAIKTVEVNKKPLIKRIFK